MSESPTPSADAPEIDAESEDVTFANVASLGVDGSISLPAVDIQGNAESGEAPAERELTPEEQEVQERLEELRIEFGEENVTDVMIDAAFDESVAEFLVAAEPAMSEINAAMNGKARFYLHREPNGELYLLYSPRHDKWNTAWVAMIDPRFAKAAFDKHGDEMLKTIMLYPSFENTDWNYEGGEKLNTPMGLTKSRLVGTFFQYELPDETKPNDVAFDGKDIGNAVAVAKRKRTSL